jgi:hypothetical protein
MEVHGYYGHPLIISLHNSFNLDDIGKFSRFMSGAEPLRDPKSLIRYCMGTIIVLHLPKFCSLNFIIIK